MANSVRDFLENSQTARVAASLDLGAGREIAIWDNKKGRISYEAPRGHVFSLYLVGGTGTRRLDAEAGTGRPGAICVLPEGQVSEWEATSQYRFMHLYLPDDQLRAAFSDIHDCDARQLHLPEMTFAEMPNLAPGLENLARAASRHDRLGAEIALTELIARLGCKPVTMKGGLAPKVLRRLEDWIEANLDGPIRLSDLAEEAGLSQFHLHRMFRVSKGIALNGWITRRRIDKAKRMIANGSPLIEVAVSCGFSSQSHLARAFKAQTGTTPGAFRKVVMPRRSLPAHRESKDLVTAWDNLRVECYGLVHCTTRRTSVREKVL